MTVLVVLFFASAAFAGYSVLMGGESKDRPRVDDVTVEKQSPDAPVPADSPLASDEGQVLTLTPTAIPPYTYIAELGAFRSSAKAEKEARHINDMGAEAHIFQSADIPWAYDRDDLWVVYVGPSRKAAASELALQTRLFGVGKTRTVNIAP